MLETEEKIMNDVTNNFRQFVDEFSEAGATSKLKNLFYCVLKTEGDILIEIGLYDMALKCFKTLKDQCDPWWKFF